MVRHTDADARTDTQTPEPSPETLTRVEADFACPSCGSTDMFSPTHRVRKCTRCGHRGSDVDFADVPTAECPDCEDTNVRTHVDDAGRDVCTCKSCFVRYFVDE